jgi:glycine betaine/proline transport system permease protein
MEFLLKFPTMEQQSLRDFKQGIDLSFKGFSRSYGESIESFFYPLLKFLVWFEKLLLNSPWIIIISIIIYLTWKSSQKISLAIGTGFCFFVIGFFGMWEDTMSTLAIISVATIICLVIGAPLGILMAKSNKTQMILSPILDMMQTIPTFVYLIPIIMLLGIGKVPGLIAVCIYAIPPIVRLTNLGIREVNQKLVEAGRALGLKKLIILYRIEFPLALPSVMTGVNQTIMMSLAMVVIAAMIGVGGLGTSILRSISNQYLALGLMNGLAIVALAIIFDRISQHYARRIQKHKDVSKR